jgi:PIN domain nuclease of toxin-antitoxin system
MDILIDTHTFLWFIEDNYKLSKNAKEIIENENNRKFLSVASAWELGIKYSIGKIQLEQNFNDFIDEQLAVNNINLLPIKLTHIKIVAELSLYHKDPFDRLMIAQAIAENLPIISIDNIFDSYPIKKIW